MADWLPFLAALGFMLAMGVSAWLITLPGKNVNLVDSLWSLFFLGGAATYVAVQDVLGLRAALVMLLLLPWSLRLSLHLARRNRGKPEDRRYQAIRANHEPGFAWKSLYIVFGLQALLAWLIAMPLFAALSSTAPLNGLDLLGAGLVLAGLACESLADVQLARFKADPASRGQVMDQGLWRYSRHPNYFGEACVWWGFWLIALAGGGAWTLFSPLLMTFLLLRVSGVALLEKDIAERRPAYREYMARTSAFLPWPPRAPARAQAGSPLPGGTQ